MGPSRSLTLFLALFANSSFLFACLTVISVNTFCEPSDCPPVQEEVLMRHSLSNYGLRFRSVQVFSATGTKNVGTKESKYRKNDRKKDLLLSEPDSRLKSRQPSPLHKQLCSGEVIWWVLFPSHSSASRLGITSAFALMCHSNARRPVKISIELSWCPISAERLAFSRLGSHHGADSHHHYRILTFLFLLLLIIAEGTSFGTYLGLPH